MLGRKNVNKNWHENRGRKKDPPRPPEPENKTDGQLLMKMDVTGKNREIEKLEKKLECWDWMWPMTDGRDLLTGSPSGPEKNQVDAEWTGDDSAKIRNEIKLLEQKKNKLGEIDTDERSLWIVDHTDPKRPPGA